VSLRVHLTKRQRHVNLGASARLARLQCGPVRRRSHQRGGAPAKPAAQKEHAYLRPSPAAPCHALTDFCVYPPTGVFSVTRPLSTCCQPPYAAKEPLSRPALADGWLDLAERRIESGRTWRTGWSLRNEMVTVAVLDNRSSGCPTLAGRAHVVQLRNEIENDLIYVIRRSERRELKSEMVVRESASSQSLGSRLESQALTSKFSAWPSKRLSKQRTPSRLATSRFGDLRMLHTVSCNRRPRGRVRQERSARGTIR
jgi:hypothetical protein